MSSRPTSVPQPPESLAAETAALAVPAATARPPSLRRRLAALLDWMLPDSLLGRLSVVMIFGVLVTQVAGGLIWAVQLRSKSEAETRTAAQHLALEQPLGTVKTNLHRARKQMATALAAAGWGREPARAAAETGGPSTS